MMLPAQCTFRFTQNIIRKQKELSLLTYKYSTLRNEIAPLRRNVFVPPALLLWHDSPYRLIIMFKICTRQKNQSFKNTFLRIKDQIIHIPTVTPLIFQCQNCNSCNRVPSTLLGSMRVIMAECKNTHSDPNKILCIELRTMFYATDASKVQQFCPLRYAELHEMNFIFM